MTNTLSGWSPNGVPFVWLPKMGLERIEQSLELAQAASAKLLYLALARVASNEGAGSFTKPINYLATLSSLNRRTVERRLPDLEKLGLMTVLLGKMKTAHHYTLMTLSRNDKTLSLNDATQRELRRVALNKELKKESTSSFDAFWALYPRKVGREVASKAYAKNGCDSVAQEIIKSVQAHKATRDWQKDGGQYVPYPATFLNQRRWEDELPQQQEIQSATTASTAEEMVWEKKL